MPGTSGPTKGVRRKKVKGVSKKAVKALNASAKKPVTKRFGKQPLKKVSETRSVGYGSDARTKLPPRKKTKPSTRVGRESLKQVRGR